MAKTILVVDDSESIRELVGFTLENAGYHVTRCINGKDALINFDKIAVDMVITDLYMPEMNGMEFIKEIRKSDANRHIPILFLTTESQLSKKEEAKQAGATGWIVKPFVPEKLLVIVKRVLR